MPLDQGRLRTILLNCLLHLLLFAGAFVFLRLLASEPVLPTADEIGQWDAVWYRSIKEDLYFYDPDRQSSVAFFPFFPFLWRFLDLSVHGIALLNMVVFYIGFGFLAYHFQIRSRLQLLLLSLPSLMFMYVPYTEAFFFLFSSFLLVAMKRRHIGFICLSLLLCALVRPVASIFIPALIITEILYSRSQATAVTTRNLLLFCGTVLLGLGLVMLLQYMQTNSLLGSFYTQKHWNHYLQFPAIPFHDYVGGIVKKTAGAATIAGGLAGFLLLRLGKDWLRKQPMQHDKALVFSMLYLLGFTLVIPLLNGGGLQSLHRYIFASAFFFVFAAHLLNNYTFSPKHLWWVAGGLTLYFLIFLGSYVSLRYFLSYVALTLYLLIYLLLKSEKQKIATAAFMVLYLLNIYLQAFFLQRFFHEEWVA